MCPIATFLTLGTVKVKVESKRTFTMIKIDTLLYCCWRQIGSKNQALCRVRKGKSCKLMELRPACMRERARERGREETSRNREYTKLQTNIL